MARDGVVRVSGVADGTGGGGRGGWAGGVDEDRPPLEVTISFSLTIFLWLSTFRILISRIAVIGNCSTGTNIILLASAHLGQCSLGAGEMTNPFFLVVHPDAFECDDFARILVPSLVHLPANTNKTQNLLPTTAALKDVKDVMGPHPYVPSPTCSTVSNTSTLREPQRSDVESDMSSSGAPPSENQDE